MSVFTEIDPADWIAHNELAFAVRDRFPVSDGHSLVIPRREVERWWDATPLERMALLDLVEVVKRRLDVEHGPDGYNVGFNDGTAAGQTVPHLHLHVIPRYDGDVPDPRGGIRHVIPGRGNYLLDATSDDGNPPRTPRQPSPPTLVTPADGRFKLELLRCLLRPDLDRIDLLVSFVMRTGIDLIARHLDEALARGAHVRLLTTDYLQITDAGALGFFLDRLGDAGPGRLDARVFSDPATSFHPKAYLFSSSTTGEGVAFVGSSNLSRSGIATGVEWNVETRHLPNLLDGFEALWDDPRSILLTADWLARYDEARRAAHRDRFAPGPPAGSTTADPTATPTGSDEHHGTSDQTVEPELAPTTVDADEVEIDPRPWSVQTEALTALEATRIEGHEAGLVVLATGLGKTWLAAFDTNRPAVRRVLFVAHREELLTQARDVFRRIRPGGSLTLFTGTERDPDGDVVFATVQSLHRHLDAFAPDAFDYLVVDEFHHAAATSYRRVLAHFTPEFLLGLTATPDRADAADLLALCSDNLVYDCGLVEGLGRGLLAPFRYRAVRDVADYEHIPWRGGRFDPEVLTTELATLDRARQVLDEWRRLGGEDRRALGFCCTIAHAEFMAEQFRAAGVAAVAVHSGAGSAARAESLERLAQGDLRVVFTVDLFNEGIDVPSVDVVLLLRPTESPVVFFQQLGRGLRRDDGKDRLDALDLVGNHRSFLRKARLLATLAGRDHPSDHEAVGFLRDKRDELAEGAAELPPGCSILVDPEVVDLLAELAGPLRKTDRLLELARQWVDDHDGRRPSALELALVTGEAHGLKAQGGWFGFLARHGLLSSDEAAVEALAGELLRGIEYGSYTKSYKLVTLGVLARSGRLRAGMPVTELATLCRWEVLRDPDLRVDLADATSSFADVTDPTPDEWARYWRKNPIHALTTTTRGASPWFREVDGHLHLDLDVPEHLSEVLDGMVGELVEYGLHRYLARGKARRVGEQRRFAVDGREVDATFTVEHHGGRPAAVVIESAGGTRDTPSARNVDYVDGFDLLLERLRDLGVRIMDVHLDTTRTRDLALADRRLDPDGLGYPLDLREVDDLVSLRKALLRSMARAGRSGDTTRGGNQRKRTRFVIALHEPWTAVDLADVLASGDLPDGVTPMSARTPISIDTAEGREEPGA